MCSLPCLTTLTQLRTLQLDFGGDRFAPGAARAFAEALRQAPQLEKLLEVKGTLDQPVHHVQFAGIAFAHAGWLRPNEMGHPDIQANFTPPEPRDPKRSAHGEHDKSPANVRLHAARSIRFDDCTFTKLGSAGIDIEYGSQDNVISGCHIHDISGSAIQRLPFPGTPTSSTWSNT